MKTPLKITCFRIEDKLFHTEYDAFESLRQRQVGEIRRAVCILYNEMGRGGRFDLERAIDVENALRCVGRELDEMFAILTRLNSLSEPEPEREDERPY